MSAIESSGGRKRTRSRSVAKASIRPPFVATHTPPKFRGRWKGRTRRTTSPAHVCRARAVPCRSPGVGRRAAASPSSGRPARRCRPRSCNAPDGVRAPARSRSARRSLSGCGVLSCPLGLLLVGALPADAFDQLGRKCVPLGCPAITAPKTSKAPQLRGFRMRRRGLEPPPTKCGPGPQPSNPGVRSVLCVHFVQNEHESGRNGRSGRSGCCRGVCHGSLVTHTSDTERGGATAIARAIS